MKTFNTEPCEIYVACLAAYNQGYLHGVWIAVSDSETMQNKIDTMLAQSPIPHAEEWEIHDYCGFYNMRLETNDLAEIVSLAEFIEQYGELGACLLSEYNLDAAQTLMDDHYSGEYASELDFAMSIFDDIYSAEALDALHAYIDYQAFARDIFIDDYFSIFIDGKTHVFESC